jgi:hypothetical protein
MKKRQVFSGIAVVCLVLGTAFGWAGRGPGPGGGGGGGGGGTPVYDDNFTSVHFSGSGNCQLCHDGLTDAAGQDVSIVRDWSSVLMANSTRDPLWRAKLRSELNRNPDLASVLHDKCTRCHAPMANTEARYWGDPIVSLGGFLEPGNLYYDAALDGVSCTLCHQVSDDPSLGTLAGYSGGYTIATFLNPLERQIYGQYADLFSQPMINHVQYTPMYSPHIEESKVCATCHNLKTPYVDEIGNVLSTTPESEFPEQMVYSEWEHSAYVNQQSCQDCHFPPTDGVVLSNRPMWLNNARDNFGTHQMVGGNRLMLDILASNRQVLGVTASDFTATADAAGQMLAGAATIDLVQSSLAAGQLEFTLKITSLTGHKLPSGIPLRRVVLHVRVTDDRGRLVFESGRVNPDGSIFGVDSDQDPDTVEPHFDLITSPEQVQVYEAVMQDNLDAVTYTLLRGMSYQKDNRLLPAGFNKTSAANDIRVVGMAEDDPNFQGGSDTIAYHLNNLTRSRYIVTAELIYQPVSFAFVHDLSLDSDPEIVAFRAMFNASGEKSSLIYGAQFTVRR